MINRAALLLKYKEPFIRWINESDPYEKHPNISKEEANKDKIVYLVDDHVAEHLKEYVSQNYTALFENELEGWYTDETLWPKNINLQLFYEWFEVECHSLLFDTGTGPLVDEDADDAEDED